jgi:hypothetical protein
VLAGTFATIHGLRSTAAGPTASLVFLAWCFVVPPSLLLAGLIGLVVDRLNRRDTSRH